MSYGLTIQARRQRNQQLVGLVDILRVSNGGGAVAVSGWRAYHHGWHTRAGKMNRASVGATVAEHVFLQRNAQRAGDFLYECRQAGRRNQGFVVHHQQGAAADLTMVGAAVVEIFLPAGGIQHQGKIGVNLVAGRLPTPQAYFLAGAGYQPKFARQRGLMEFA